MKNIFLLSLSLCATVTFIAACNKSSPQSDHTSAPTKEKTHSDDHEGHESASEGEEGAKFAEGKGLQLDVNTLRAIGVSTIEASEKTLANQQSLAAQVYRSASETSSSATNRQHQHAYASSMIDSSKASDFKQGTRVEVEDSKKPEIRLTGKIFKIDHTMENFNGQNEILIEINDPSEQLEVGSFINVRFSASPKKGLVIPKSALLDSATGTFVYVKNGDFLLRTEVKTGVSQEDDVEIIDGLYEGDIVVEKPVEKLWLTELRLTKGGGHSH